MNFGLALATQKIPGIRVNLLALNNNHEPESADEALRAFSKILLPERDNEENIKRLTAMVRDANVEQKIAVAADKTKNNTDEEGEEETRGQGSRDKEDIKKEVTSMAQVVGIIIGSPEFQRK
ncbi:MAG: hypothetical protein IBJ16_01610 [Chitinophagaceae bacterium]|nr:hypothetical protein [Chitinophagaceae bacterium]